MRSRHLRTVLLLFGLYWLMPPLRCAAQAAPATPRSTAIQWTFRDIDIQTLLGRLKSFGVELALPASGQVTVRLSISAPWRSIFSAGAYEVNGDLSSPALTVAGIELKNLTLHLQYKDGIVDLSQMRFAVPGDGEPEGIISGKAHMQAQPPGDLDVDLTVDKLPLSALGGVLPVLAGQVNGSASGRFNGHAPADRLRDLSAWQAEGRLTLAGLSAFGLPAAAATTDLRLSAGQATIARLTANVLGTSLDASGQLSLTSPYAFTSRLRATVPNLDWLNQLDAGLRPPVAIAGDFSVSAAARGQLAGKTASLRGTLEGRRLKADKLTIDHLLVPFEGTLRSIRVRNLLLELYGGRVKAHLNLPSKPDGNIAAGVRIDNVDLSRAAADLFGQAQDWHGVAAGSLQLLAPLSRLTDLGSWTGQGQLAFGPGALFGIDVSRLETKVQVAKGRLNLNDLSIASSLAQITGGAQADLTAPFTFSTALRIAEVDFAPLNRLPETLRPPLTVGGRAGISLRVQGALRPFDFTARGGVATRRLRADRFVVDSLNFNFQLTPKTVSLSQIAGELYGGRFDGSAGLPLNEQGRSQVQLSWRQIDLARMLAAANVDLRGVRAQGTASGQVSAQSAGHVRDPAGWQATARVDLAGLRINQAAIGQAMLDVSLDQQVLSVSRLVSKGGAMTVNGSARLALKTPQDFGLKLNVTNADLALANTLPEALRPPVNIGGLANVSADVKGKLNPLSLQGGGRVSARNLRVAGARADALSFSFRGESDLLKISEFALVAYRGRLDGQLTVPLAAKGAAAIDVRWQRVNIGALLTDLRGVASQALAAKATAARLSETLSQAKIEGWTWGSLAVNAPPGKLLDPAAWTGKVDIALAAMRLFGWAAKQGFINGGIGEGRADLSRLSFDIGGTRLRGAARLNLSQPYDYDARFSLDEVRLADFNSLPETVRPPVELSGMVNISAAAQGTLEPLAISGNGTLTGHALQADGARLDRLAVRFDADKNRLALTNFQADLYGGQIQGGAAVALNGDEPGRVDFNWRQVNLGQLISDVAKLPVALRGTLAGRLHVDIPGGKLAAPLDWSMETSFDTSPLGTRAATIAELHGRLTYDGQLLDYRLHGELLRGAVEAVGRWQPRPFAAPINEGRFQFRRARLDAIAALLGRDSAIGSLTGTVGAEVAYRHAENGLPIGAGQVTIDDLRLNGGDLLDELRGRILLAADRVETTDVNASFGGGLLNMSAVAYFDPKRRGLFRLTVSGADLAQLLATSPRIAAQIGGHVDAQFRGFFGARRPLIFSGTVAVARARAAGVAVNGLRAPIKGSIDLGSGRGTLELHGLTGQIAHGRVSGNVDLALADGIGLAGRGTFADVDLRALLRNSRSAGRLAGGKISGDFTIAGRNVRTVNDLAGTFDATLRDAQAMSLPVLERTVPYLTGGVSGSTTFGEGTVRAVLARGVLRVERFSMSSGGIQIYAQGKVTLAGRLDLNVTVKTGQMNMPQRTLTMLASRVLLVAAPPVGLLLSVTQFLSNQVVNLEVTGTVRAPAIRIKPLNLLGQEAAQFFLMQSLP